MRSLKSLMDLTGRVALLAGGGHIGRAAAEALAELGASVAVLDVSETACRTLAADIHEAYGVPTWPLVTDLADEAAVKRVPEQIAAEWGRLDILLHGAALVGTSDLEGWIGPFEKQRAETWRQALEVNLTSAFVLTQAAAPLLARSGHGSVIYISSIYGLVGPDMRLYEGTPLGNPVAYAASKGGLLQLMRWLSTVLAPAVRVNAISPGGVERGQPPEFQARYVERAPLGRMASEEDLKGAVAYLASDLSGYVTGQNLVVDGGWTAW